MSKESKVQIGRGKLEGIQACADNEIKMELLQPSQWISGEP